MVIVCDYKMRKFQRRPLLPGEDAKSEMAQIEDSIVQYKTKLNAALARSRISSNVLTLDSLLPEAVRKNDQIGSSMTICCWINYFKTRFNQHISIRRGVMLLLGRGD